jgi:hypothetical protein
VLDARSARFRHWSLAALGAWNVLVWSSRGRNIVLGDEHRGWLVPVAFFVAGGVLCLYAFWRGRDRAQGPVLVVAGGGALYWVVRTAGVLVADHSLAFKVVHAALAVVSVVLGALVVRRLRRADVVPEGAFL